MVALDVVFTAIRPVRQSLTTLHVLPSGARSLTQNLQHSHTLRLPIMTETTPDSAFRHLASRWESFPARVWNDSQESLVHD